LQYIGAALIVFGSVAAIALRALQAAIAKEKEQKRRSTEVKWSHNQLGSTRQLGAPTREQKSPLEPTSGSAPIQAEAFLAQDSHGLHGSELELGSLSSTSSESSTNL
jgi:type II secretory pathway pseudopilin PulG